MKGERFWGRVVVSQPMGREEIASRRAADSEFLLASVVWSDSGPLVTMSVFESVFWDEKRIRGNMLLKEEDFGLVAINFTGLWVNVWR